MTIKKSPPLGRLAISAFAAAITGYLGWLHWPALEAMPTQRPAPQSIVDPAEVVEQAVGDNVPAVGTFTVRRTDLSIRAEATGYLDPIRALDLASESAQNIESLEVWEGQWVEAGRRLVTFDSRLLEIELAEAEADLLKTRAIFAIKYGDSESPAPVLGSARGTAGQQSAPTAEAELQRLQALFDQGLRSKQAVLEAGQRLELAKLRGGSRQRDVQAATSGLTQSEQRVARARLQLESNHIAAPFAGRIVDLEVDAGQLVNAGERCLTLIDDSHLRVDVAVLEADFVALRAGGAAAVKVPAIGDSWQQARILTINPKVDSDRGTGRVTLGLDNPEGRLMPGLFAYARLETRRLENRLAVPIDAVLERQGRHLVFRIVDGKALWTWVEIGERADGLVEVLDGLTEGDVVAVDNHFSLAHESTVAPRSPTPARSAS